MSFGKNVGRRSIKLLVMSVLLTLFLTGTLIVSVSALNANSRTNIGTTSEGSPSLYPLPKSPYPASTLYVVGVGGPSSPLGFTVAALQGIVARTQPQIFLTTNPEDQAWLQYLENSYGIKAQSRTATQIIQQFQ